MGTRTFKLDTSEELKKKTQSHLEPFCYFSSVDFIAAVSQMMNLALHIG